MWSNPDDEQRVIRMTESIIFNSLGLSILIVPCVTWLAACYVGMYGPREAGIACEFD